MTDYVKLGQEIGELVQSKNQAYGSSFTKAGDILAILYPDGVQPHQYVDMLAIIRIVDKLFRVATDKDAFGEDPFKDICGYALLAVAGLAATKESPEEKKLRYSKALTEHFAEHTKYTYVPSEK